MNNGKMWLVVKPTVGIPVFLGAVAIGSLAVHVGVLTYYPQVSTYLTQVGQQSAAIEAPATKQNAAAVIFDESAQAREGDLVKATVVLPDGREAHAYFDADPAAKLSTTAMTTK